MPIDEHDIVRAEDLIAKANQAERDGLGAEAVRLWKELADTFDDDEGVSAKAAALVGMAYLDGEDAPQDYATAIQYLRKGAAADIPLAFTGLGKAYRQGAGVPKDAAEAVRYFQRAVAGGNLEASFLLGTAYLAGDGVAKDHVKGVALLRTVLTSDDPRLAALAQHAIGVCYETGHGVPKDIAAAMRWQKKAGKVIEEAKADFERLKKLGGGQRRDLIWDVLLVALSIVVVTVLLLYAQIKFPSALLAIPLAAVFWSLFRLMARGGVAARARVGNQFTKAATSPMSDIRISGKNWCIANGEFHHLATHAGNRGSSVNAETSRDQRLRLEFTYIERRRGERHGFAIGLAIGGLIVASNVSPIVGGIIGGYSFLGILQLLVREYLYHHAYQAMTGAMVLDPDPQEIARKEVEQQKVHGNQRYASQTESLRAASAAPDSNPLDERDF